MPRDRRGPGADPFRDELETIVRQFIGRVTVLASGAALEAASSALARSRAAGGRLGPAERASMGATVVSYLLSHPGQTVGALRDALAVPHRPLALVLKRLVADGLVRSEGVNRRRRYFPDPSATSAATLAAIEANAPGFGSTPSHSHT